MSWVKLLLIAADLIEKKEKGVFMSENCIFCKIVSGEIPAKVVYEDDICLAFDDVEPEAPVHTLLVPKKHYDNLNDDIPEEVLGHLLKKLPEVAGIKGVRESGYRTIMNTGPDSAASVGHLHMHMMGGVLFGRATFENSMRYND